MKTSCILPLLCGLAAALPVVEPDSSSVHISHLRRSWGPRRPAHQTSLTYPYGSHYFYTDITLGNQSFTVTADLGSSDLWVPSPGFKCTVTPCGIQATYHIDSTFSEVTDEVFFAPYGAGSVSGITGFETVTVAGITIPRQQIGVPDIVSIQAFEESSGIMGLAFPGITGTYKGTNITAIESNPKKYLQPSSSTINTIFSVDNLTAPVISIALSRDTSNTSYGGVLVIGGKPNLKLPTVNASAESARVPIELSPTLAGPAYGYYAFNTSGISFSNATAATSNSTSLLVFADSGSPTISLPEQIVKEINAMFDPPAKLTPKGYSVECDAIPPQVAITIGGRAFSISPPDLIWHSITNVTAKEDSPYTIQCLSALNPISLGPAATYSATSEVRAISWRDFAFYAFAFPTYLLVYPQHHATHTSW